MKNILNIIGFQIGWWVCALGAQNSLDYLGPLYMATFIIIHMRFISKKYSEFILILFGIFLGLLVDSSFKYLNIINYSSINFNSYYAPSWIIAMWAGFCATLNHSLSWLKTRILASFFLGAIFGPLSYVAGLNMNIIFFISSQSKAILILAIVWGISIPGLFWINNKLNLIFEKYD